MIQSIQRTPVLAYLDANYATGSTTTNQSRASIGAVMSEAANLSLVVGQNDYTQYLAISCVDFFAGKTD